MFVDAVLAAPSHIQGHWAEDQIIHWTDRNLTAGYPDDTFRPDRNITRAEFIALINKAMGFITEEEFSYSDVSPGDWFAAERAPQGISRVSLLIVPLKLPIPSIIDAPSGREGSNYFFLDS